jgi:uncharacterized RDD family membrane protein YckC
MGSEKMNADIQMLISMLTTSLGWGSLALMIVASVPPIFILYSKKVSGSKKALWFILTGIFSWLAYLPFLWMHRNANNEATKP